MPFRSASAAKTSLLNVTLKYWEGLAVISLTLDAVYL